MFFMSSALLMTPVGSGVVLEAAALEAAVAAGGVEAAEEELSPAFFAPAGGSLRAMSVAALPVDTGFPCCAADWPGCAAGWLC
jgi:hypothetical protein